MKSKIKLLGLILILVYFLTSCKFNQQGFEGVIRYSVKLTYDTTNLSLNRTINQLKVDGDIPVDTIVYGYRSNGWFYTTSTYKDKSFHHIYNNDEKVLYNIYHTDSVAVGLKVNLPDIQSDLIARNLRKDTLVFQNKLCDALVYKWNEGIYKYYFQSDVLNINPDLFNGFVYEKFHDFLNVSNSLPVRMEKEIFGLYTIEFQLIDYSQNENLDTEMFRIPSLKEFDMLKGVYKNKSIYEIRPNL